MAVAPIRLARPLRPRVNSSLTRARRGSILDHLAIVVADLERSRDRYPDTLGLEVEFEIPERKVAAMRNDAGLTLFVGESPGRAVATCVLTFQVDDVERLHLDLAARGVVFEHAPQKLA